jgi:hypothetical protein
MTQHDASPSPEGRAGVGTGSTVIKAAPLTRSHNSQARGRTEAKMVSTTPSRLESTSGFQNRLTRTLAGPALHPARGRVPHDHQNCAAHRRSRPRSAARGRQSPRRNDQSEPAGESAGPLAEVSAVAAKVSSPESSLCASMLGLGRWIWLKRDGRPHGRAGRSSRPGPVLQGSDLFRCLSRKPSYPVGHLSSGTPAHGIRVGPHP